MAQQQIMPSQRNGILTKSEIVAAYLQQMGLPSLWNRVLSDSDYELWDSVLQGYSLEAIRFAFDNWITSGARFPQPHDIVPMCISFQEQQEQLKNPKPPRGQRLEGGNAEVLAVWNAVIARKNRFLREEKEYQPMTDGEINQLVASMKSGGMEKEWPVEPTHWPNGNPRGNRALTQARALRFLEHLPDCCVHKYQYKPCNCGMEPEVIGKIA